MCRRLTSRKIKLFNMCIMKIDKSTTTIHNHYYSCVDQNLFLEKLNYLIAQNKSIMATSQERYDAINERLNVITNDIAADYKKLLEEAKNKTISDESLAKGEANVLRLEALGASVDNPVPEETQP